MGSKLPSLVSFKSSSTYSKSDFNFSELNENQTREIFSAMLISVNGFLSAFERIVNFSVIDRDFSLEKNDMIKP